MSKKFCAVAVCNNTSYSDRGLSWHRFPKSDDKLRREWIRRCGRSGPINLSHSRICSAHFAPEAFQRNYKEKLMGISTRRYLKANAVPTLNLEPDVDLRCEETSGPYTRKRKLSPAADDHTASTGSGNNVTEFIAKSKRTWQPNGKSSKTEEIVFEIDESDDDTCGDDDRSMEYPKENNRQPEKGVFECSLYITDDEDDITMFKNEITILTESSKPSSADPTSDSGKVSTSDSDKIFVNGDEPPSCAFKVSNGCEKILDVESTSDPELTCKMVENDFHGKANNNANETSTETKCTDQRRSNQMEHLAKEEPEITKEKPEPHNSMNTEQVEKLFTQNQLKSLMRPNKRIRWTDDEIVEAIRLRFYSLPMFKYLKNKKGYPFPGRVAISRWARKMKLRGGTLHSVLKILELGGQPSAEARKCGMKDFCVLSLGEIKVKESMEYDEIEDEIVGPFKKMQVMMASSLTGSWQQPVFVDFDSNITKSTVINVIVQLYSIGYYVVCFSSDCSDTSLKLWTDLGATVDSPCFSHPVKDSRIVVIPDTLHAIRRVRDALLDGGFEIEGSAVNRMPLDVLLDTGVCSKVRPYHLQPNDKEKRRTDLAVQLVSSTIGTVLNQRKPGDAEVATSTGNFLIVMSHWFDLMNVSTSELTVPFRSPYGYRRLEQDKLLELVKSVISSMKYDKNSTQQTFQIGIIMSCDGISLLLDETKKHFKMEYIPTQRLNHTCIDNLFSLLTYEFSQVPTPVLAQSRLQQYIFGGCSDSPSKNYSVFTSVARRTRIKLDSPRRWESLTQDLLGVIFSTDKSKYVTNDNLSHQCLNLIAEKINSALGGKYPQLCKFPNVDEQDSNSHEPTAFFLGNLVKMENVFVNFTRGLIAAECKNIVDHLTLLMKGCSNSLPVEVIKVFARVRTEIYARSLVPTLSQILMKRMVHARLLMAIKENVDETKSYD